MGSIGDLNLRVRADSGPFRGDMRQMGRGVTGLRGTIGRLSTGIGGLVSSLGPAGTAIVSVGGALAAFRGFTKLSAEIDSAAKSARLLGVELRQLEGIKFGGELSGVDSNKVIGGLKTMQKRIGEAARGSGAAIPALKELGLDAKDLVSQDAIKSLVDIADAFKGIEEPARRAAIASNIFSKGNMEMLLLVSQGGDALRDYIANMEDMSSITSENAKEFETFNDNMAKMWRSVKEKSKSAGLVFAQATNELVGGLGLVEAAAESIDLDVDGLRDMTSALDDMAKKADTVAVSLRAMGQSARDGFDAMERSLSMERGRLRGEDPTEQQIRGLISNAQGVMPGDDIVQRANDLRYLAKGIREAKVEAEQLSNVTNAKDFLGGLKSELAGLKNEPAGLESGLAGTTRFDETIKDFGKQGIDPLLIKEMREVNKELDDMSRKAKAVDVARAIVDRTRTPMEEFKKTAKDLDNLLSVLGEKFAPLARREFAAAEQTLAASVTTPDVFTGRAEVGSAEAYRIISRAQAGGAAISPQEKILIEGKKQTKHLSNLDAVITKSVEELEPQEVAETMP